MEAWLKHGREVLPPSHPDGDGSRWWSGTTTAAPSASQNDLVRPGRHHYTARASLRKGKSMADMTWGGKEGHEASIAEPLGEQEFGGDSDGNFVLFP